MSKLLKGAFSGPKLDLLTKQIELKSNVPQLHKTHGLGEGKGKSEEGEEEKNLDQTQAPPLTAFQLKVNLEFKFHIGKK